MISKTIEVWGKSHKGKKRQQNEDRFLIRELPKLLILAVADGVGGNVFGEKAAEIVIDTFHGYEFSPDNLEKDMRAALETADKRIHHEVKKNAGLHGMSATATICVLYRNQVFWIHVGDSRMYLFHDKKITQITRDHTFIQDLIDDGSLTPDQAEKHPLKNMLDQCVGCDEIEPDNGVFNIEKHDRLLLCSDGLTTHLSDSQIESILKKNPIQEAGRRLLCTALQMGGKDNVTVIVSEFFSADL